MMSVEREIFSKQDAHATVLRVLMAFDGSTTRLCEAIVQAPIEIFLHHQERTTAVLPEVQQTLGGQEWLCRITSLQTNKGVVMMDNLSFTRLDLVPAWFLQALEESKTPIGHLLEGLYLRRESVPTSQALHDLLWQHVGLSDERSGRSYCIITPQGRLMLIYEAFRAGMLGMR